MIYDVRNFRGGGCCDALMSTDYKDPIKVAYIVENHPADSRVSIDDSGIVQTLSARMGTGGGNTPMLLMCNESPSCYAIDSHPTDSRIRIVEGVCPTVTAHVAKVGSDGPLVLIKSRFYQNTGQGWWNESEIAETLRTPCGGDSMKANLVLTMSADGENDK